MVQLIGANLHTLNRLHSPDSHGISCDILSGIVAPITVHLRKLFLSAIQLNIAYQIQTNQLSIKIVCIATIIHYGISVVLYCVI